jgi:hypothetical protein
MWPRTVFEPTFGIQSLIYRRPNLLGQAIQPLQGILNISPSHQLLGK